MSALACRVRAWKRKRGESVGAAERRQLILDLLCQRRRETISNLAAELGVSERTIRRDVEMLTLRYPIETVCGRYGGGVRMADWYQQGRQRLTPRQTALLRRLAAGLQGEDLEDMKQILTQFAS
nr:DeoR family transcriptional regulator [Dysosmobacter welbionis]